MGKPTKRQLADSAWLRLNTPDNTGALPGQLDIEGQIAETGNAQAREVGAQAPRLTTGRMPDRCPDCDATLTLAHGWAYSREAPWTIQCPRCGVRFEVDEHLHATYREAVREYYRKLPPAPLPKRRKRERGAG